VIERARDLVVSQPARWLLIERQSCLIKYLHVEASPVSGERLWAWGSSRRDGIGVDLNRQERPPKRATLSSLLADATACRE
jgi:hypothetical protein